MQHCRSRRVPRRLSFAVACGRIDHRPTRRLRPPRRDRGLDRPPRRRLRGPIRCGHRLAPAELAGAVPRAVPARRGPHRLAVPAREAPAGHRRARLEAARCRGLRRHLEQQLARPRSRHRRTGGERRRLGVAARRGGTRRPGAAVGGAPRPRRERRGPHARQAATPHTGVGRGNLDPRRVRRVGARCGRDGRATLRGGSSACTTSRALR